MTSLDPTVVRREVGHLADDLARLLPRLRAQLRDAAPGGVERVAFVGNGDSLFAGMCAAFALRRFAGLPSAAVTPLELVAYPAGHDAATLVVALSASGNTPGTVDAVRKARARGARTLAVTGSPGSRLHQAAEAAVVAELPGKEPSPGIRSYQASLLALLLLALELGSRRGLRTAPLHDELDALAPAVAETVAALEPAVEEAAGAADPAAGWTVAGAGPNRGTAHFCAAKVVECLGRPAAPVDLDEWWHLDRHLLPPAPPLLVLAPPGAARDTALTVAAAAAAAGRTVYAAACARDGGFAPRATLFPVAGEAREELSPLLWHLPGTMLAGRVAEAGGVRLFPARDLAAAAAGGG